MATMPVEWGKVREFATATAAARPAYLDDPRAPVPPTFLTTVTYWERIGKTVRAPEVVEACAAAGVAAGRRNLLALEQEFVFHGPVPRAGETLHTSERLHDVRVKRARSGPMVVVRFIVSFRDEGGGLRAECWYTSAFMGKRR